MRVISQREFRNNSAAVMDAVEAGAAIVDFDPLPFDGDAATRYGTLAGLTLAANCDPKPRRMDLMIAAIASAHGLPLYTRNADGFEGLQDMLTVVAI